MKQEFKSQEDIQYLYDQLAKFVAGRKGLYHNSNVLDDIGLVSTFQYSSVGREVFTDFISESARGIAFKMGALNKPNSVLVHPYPKFFNWGESEVDAVPFPRDQVRKVTAKVDGSLGVAFSYKGKLYIKSNKSYTSEIISDMKSSLEKDLELKDLLTKITTGVFTNGELCTVMFEYVSRETTVVIGVTDEYADGSFTITGVRINGEVKLLDLDTLPIGKYAVEDLTDKVDIYGSTVEETQTKLNDYHCGVSGVEGLVVELNDGRMFKVKTEWYLKKHAIYNIGYFDALIVEAVLDDKIDDVLAAYIENKERWSYIDNIRRVVLSYIETMNEEIEKLPRDIKDMDAKSAFAYVKYNASNSAVRGIVMGIHNGRNVDRDDLIRKYINRNYDSVIGSVK